MPIKKTFLATERSGISSELSCFANVYDEIYIEIITDFYSLSTICLDVPTAKKLIKKLKKEIDKIGGE